MKTLKILIIGIIILGIVFLLGYFIFDGGTPGALIAGLASGWAAFRSNAFSMKGLSEKLTGLEQEHEIKHQEWQGFKDEYDNKYNALKARIDYLDYRTLLIREQLSTLDNEEKEKIGKLKNMTIEEKLKLLGEL